MVVDCAPHTTDSAAQWGRGFRMRGVGTRRVHIEHNHIQYIEEESVTLRFYPRFMVRFPLWETTTISARLLQGKQRAKRTPYRTFTHLLLSSIPIIVESALKSSYIQFHSLMSSHIRARFSAICKSYGFNHPRRSCLRECVCVRTILISSISSYLYVCVTLTPTFRSARV